MRKLLIFIFLIFIVLPIKNSLSQTLEKIGPVTTKVICLQYFDNIKMPESALNNATSPGVYLVITGKDSTKSDGGCNVAGPADKDKNLIWLDLVIVGPDGRKEWINLDDIQFQGQKVYGGGCQTETSIYTTVSTGPIGTSQTSYLFETYCSDGLKSGGVSFSGTAYSILYDLIKWQKIIKDTRPSTFFTSQQKKEETSEPSAIQGEAVIDPCSNQGLFQTFLGIVPTGINDKGVACVILKVGLGMTSVILDFISFISKTLLKWTIGAATNFQMAFNHVLSGVLNVVARLDPFSRDIGTVVWRTLRDLAYIVLVFSALYVGFIWLFEGKGAAFSLIFNIILVALIINFSYAFVKLVFTIAFQIEDGISGGTKAQFGEFILGALWQGNFIGSWQNIVKDYEKYINKDIPYVPQSVALKILGLDQDLLGFYLNQLVQKIKTTLFDIVNIIAVSLMPLMIAMVISGALAMMIVLFMYRFITIIRLLITSPLAILSLAYPNKGPLGKYLPQFPFTFDNWLSEIVKWAVVIPIFMFMVVLGVVFQQNFVSMSQADVSMEDFIFVFIFLLFWFVFSFNVASGLSGVSAGIAKAAAALPGWALGKLAWGIAQRFGLARWGGEGLKGVGKFLEEKVSNVPVLKQLAGWQIRSFGKRLQDLGDKVMEKDYLVRNRPRVVEDMKNLWKEFTKNPNPQTWKNFSDYVGGIAQISAFKEDIQKFIEGLQREPSRLSLILQHDTNNNFLKIEPVGEKIDDVFNRLKTAITDYDKPSGQDAFVEFLERSSVDKIKAAFIGLLPNRWSVLQALLDSTQNRIITRDIAPKLVEVALSIFNITTPAPVTNREQLARWILQNENAINRILTGKRDAQALLQEAVNQFRNQGINP